MEVRSMLTGILSRRNTASHRWWSKTQGAPPQSAAIYGCAFLLSKEYEKTGEYRMWYPPATEVKAFPTAALSTSGIGNDDKIGKSGQRKILAQMKVWKFQKYWIYFGFFKLHSWDKRSAVRQSRFYQRFLMGRRWFLPLSLSKQAPLHFQLYK